MDIYGLPYILLRDLRISTGWSWYIKSKQWLKSLDQSELVNVNLHDETDGFFLEPIIYESVPLPNITQYHPISPTSPISLQPHLTQPHPQASFTRVRLFAPRLRLRRLGGTSFCAFRVVPRPHGDGAPSALGGAPATRRGPRLGGVRGVAEVGHGVRDAPW